MSDFQNSLRRILADRHSPEAAALFQSLLEFTHNRVRRLSRGRCRGLLTESEAEEVLGEVLYQLMRGGLARFRGESMPELLGFVRTTTDRTAWRIAERNLRERDAVATFATEQNENWTPSAARRAEDSVDFEANSPLPKHDRTYLTELLRAGSKAELARQAGVSRAAVTQRVRRIRDRIDSMSRRDRQSHEAWIHQAAQGVLFEQAGSG